MQTFIRIKHALLTALVLAMSLGLVACSDDAVTSPADPAAPTALDEAWNSAVADLAAHAGPDVMADLQPQLDQARAQLGDMPLKHGRRLYLSYATTSFDDDLIYSDGWSTLSGHFTASATFELDYTTDPFGQTTVTTITDTDGDQYVIETVGYFTVSEDGIAIQFWGDGAFSGGTGDYAGIGGSARYIGDASFATASGRILYMGWVSLNHR